MGAFLGSATVSAHADLARFVLVARLVCAGFIVVCLLPAVVLIALNLGFTTEGIAENAFMLGIFGCVALLAMVAGVVGYLAVLHFARNVVLHAIASPLFFGTSGTALMFGFVGSVLARSAIPYMAMFGPVVICWIVTWPREARWERSAAT
jgi:hypothetical protein